MKTERLYYKDSELCSFSATVLSCEQGKSGFEVVLDRTAFYPEGGGQPGDIGTIDDAAVLDTKLQNGEIIHICNQPLAVGKTVQGSIDYPRRFSYMQQHSGEHIVSGIVHRRFGYENVGFHMGADVVTIDFSGILSAEDLQQIEREANEAVWKNLPLEITFLSDENKDSVSYRSKKELSGEIRIVTMPGYDVCACCGTHVRFTGEIGLIKLLSCQKFHDGVRIEMLCGEKAYDAVCALVEQNRQNSVLLSAKPQQTAESVQRTLDELSQVKFRIGQLERQIVSVLVAENREENPLVFADLSPDAQRSLADGLMQKTSGVCAVFCGSDEGGYKYAVAQKGGSLKDFSQALNGTLHGRGGGKPDFLQGSVSAARTEIENFYREWFL